LSEIQDVASVRVTPPACFRAGETRRVRDILNFRKDARRFTAAH